MSNGVLLSRDLALRTKTFIEGLGAGDVKTPEKSIVSGFAGFVAPVELTTEWNNEDDKGWKAKMKRLWYQTETGEYHSREGNDNETDIFYPLSLDKPKGSTGTRAFAIFRGRWEVIAFGDVGESGAKELFPAIVYRKSETETYVICPGGRNEDQSIKAVHVLHVESRTVSSSKFGALPMAMSNFGAVIADNGYGSPVLVCAPGEVESGTKYPVQRYDFVTEEWVKSDTTQSLAGCPAYVKDGKMIVAGGQSAYFVSNPVKTAGSSVTQFFGHNVTPFWSIEPATGNLETRTPRRLITSGTTEQPESNIVNQQKRFLKQNFSGIHYEHNENGRPVEFIAVGGMELLGYQSKAVVSYAMDSLGILLSCEHNTVGVYDNCEIFPDTPIPFGECCAVRIDNSLVCIGGRYRTEEDVAATDASGNAVYDENGTRIILYKKGEFIPHKKVWTLDLTEKVWRDNRYPEIPTPRWNAALSDVVTTRDDILDNDGKSTGEKRNVSRIFLIGGRTDNRTVEKVTRENGTFYHKLVTQKGLTASIESLNLTTGKWETDFPNL